ncbi:MAG: hypothetical protein GKS05_03815 [Nitrospirales bacterium]|nr:hypothetical protein [Nitrospirales bacterium]
MRKPTMPDFQQIIENRPLDRSRGLRILSIMLVCFSLSSCVAQQADLDRFQQEFDRRISKLHQNKQILETSLAKAELRVDKLKSELEQLVRNARAQFNNELRNIREENLTTLSGELEKRSFEISQVNQQVDDLRVAITNMRTLSEQRDAKQKQAIETVASQFKTNMKQQETATQKSIQNIGQSLTEFRNVLDGLSLQLGKETKRAGQAESNLQALVNKQHVALTHKLDQDTQALRTYIERDIAETLRGTTNDLHTTQTALGKLKEVLDSSVNKIGKAIDTHAQQVSTTQIQLTRLQGQAKQFEQDSQGTHKQLQEVTKSLTQLHETLGQTGKTLSQHGEQQEKELVLAKQRLTALENHHAALLKKLKADTQTLRTYLQKDVNTSLSTIGQSMETLKQRLAKQIEQLRVGANAVQQESHLTAQQVQQHHQQIQELHQATGKLKETFRTVGNMLGQRADNQIQSVGQLSERMSQLEQKQTTAQKQFHSDTQSIATHLAKVNESVQSVTAAIAQVEEALSTRVKTLEQHMANTQPSAAMQEVRQEVTATIQHVNQLTGTVGQLREIIQSIGTKTGDRVDQQAQHIAELTQQLNNLQAQDTVPATQP